MKFLTRNLSKILNFDCYIGLHGVQLSLINKLVVTSYLR